MALSIEANAALAEIAGAQVPVITPLVYLTYKYVPLLFTFYFFGQKCMIKHLLICWQTAGDPSGLYILLYRPYLPYIQAIPL